jgi:hypothetical protein
MSNHAVALGNFDIPQGAKAAALRKYLVSDCGCVPGVRYRGKTWPSDHEHQEQ